MLSSTQKTSVVCAAITFLFAVLTFIWLDPWIGFVFFMLHTVFMVLLALFSIRSKGEDNEERISNIKAQWRQETDALKERLSESESAVSSLKQQESALREANTLLGAEIKRLEDEANRRKKGYISSNELNYISILPKLPDESADMPVVNLLSIAKTVADELSKDALKAGLTINVSSAEKSVPIKADRDLIRILFRNIVDNSIKYMNRKGNLIITISSIGDDIFIIFKDTGEGLSDDETDHIFELNYQGSNRISGNGLGLFQAKAIVNYYGGTIYAKSQFGRGMGIYIQLPACEV